MRRVITIKFMFNSPNDTSLLYACTDEVGESPFGGEDAITVEIRHSKEYSEAILADVKSCLYPDLQNISILVAENVLPVKRINLQ